MAYDATVEDDPVWEASVALALRDSQWIENLGKGLPMASPRSHIPLSAKAESALGDVLFPLADRYFIFELKASRDRIESEWRPKDINGKKHAAKAAHRTLHSMMEEWEFCQYSQGPRRAAVLYSLAAHFFVYWVDEEVVKLEPQSGLTVESYLHATADLCKAPEWKKWLSCLNDRFKFASHTSGQPPGGNAAYDETETLGISVINRDRGRLLEFAPGQITAPTTVFQLGLPAKHFQNYVDLLIGGSGQQGGPIRAVITNGDGTFARLVTHTRDLSALFSPAPGPALRVGKPKNKQGRRFIGPPPAPSSPAPSPPALISGGPTQRRRP